MIVINLNKTLCLSNSTKHLNQFLNSRQNNLICTNLSISLTKKSLILSPKTKTSIRTLYTTKQNLTFKLFDNEIDSNKLSVKPFVHNKLSYAFGRSNKELMNIKFQDVIDNIRNKKPNARAVVVFDENISKTYEDLDNDINKLVNGLVNKLKLKKGDRVGIFSSNNYQYLLIQFACLKLGLIMNPFNSACKANEFYHMLTKSEVNVLFMPGTGSKQSKLNDHSSIICDKSLLELQNNGLLNNLTDIILLDGNLKEEELNIKNIKIHDWKSLIDNSSINQDHLDNLYKSVDSDDIYGVYYTSGTTGAPKGAAISQFNAINNCKFTAERFFIERKPTFDSIIPNVCLPLPLFHEYAGIFGLLSPFFYGGSVVLIGLKYDINMLLEAIIKHNCNVLLSTPTILFDFINFVIDNKIDTKSLPIKSILIGGSPVMPELLNKTYRTFRNLEDIRIAYGSTENGVVSTLQTTNESLDTRLKSVGPPLDFTEIRIVDTRSGLITPLNEPGEVQTRGFNTMLCYHNEPKGTESAITKTRWYKTGDLGTIDEHGSLKISGRIKDLIIKGGENIYPAEVEAIIHTHEAIDDAYIIGVPDKRYGEEVCAWIKLVKKFKSQNEDKLREDIKLHCREKMTYNKVPKYILFVDEFPSTPIKKVKKFEMVAQSINILNLNWFKSMSYQLNTDCQLSYNI